MNIKKLLFAFPLLLLSATGFAQLQVNNGSSFSMLAGTTLSLSDNLTVQTAGTIDNAGTIIMQRDLVNNGTATFIAPGELIFNGSVAQQISSNVPLIVSHAVINNGAGVTFNAPITITDSLNLVNGILYTDGLNPVHFDINAVNPAEGNTNYIVGTAIMDSRQVGNSSINQFLGCTIAPGANIGDVTITRTTGPDAVLNILSNTSIQANWKVTTSIPIASGGRDIAFSWLSNFDNTKDMTHINLYGSTDLNTFEQINQGYAVDVSTTSPRIFVQSGVSKFNRIFTLTDSTSLLAVAPIAAASVTELKVYPNPVRDVCYVQLQKTDNDPVYIYLTDISGKVVMNTKSDAGTETTIQLQNLNALVPGIYLLHISNEHFSRNYKLVKAE